jgi:hypothetical protein
MIRRPPPRGSIAILLGPGQCISGGPATKRQGMSLSNEEIRKVYVCLFRSFGLSFTFITASNRVAWLFLRKLSGPRDAI